MAVEIWTLSALVGAVAAVYGAVEAYLDLKALQEGNGARLVALQRLFAQSVRSTILLTWLVLGLWFILNDIEAQFTITVAILVIGNILTTVIAVSDAVVGRILRRG